MTTTYPGWWAVPEHLMSAGSLAELEFPRMAPDRPAGRVETRDWRDRRTTVALYDARSAPVSRASGAQLEAAAARATRSRRCADCGANCQRPPAIDVQDRPLCPACRHVALLREAQDQAATGRADAARTAAQLLMWPRAAIVQVDLTVPAPAPSGRARPATAARIRAVDAAGARLVDVTVRLLGPRAQHVPAQAIGRDQAAPTVHRALLDRPLILWQAQELDQLRAALPHREWPTYRDEPQRCAAVHDLSVRWRGQLNPQTRQLIDSLPPGSPERLLLHLRRAAATA